MMMQDHASRQLRIGDIAPVFLEVGAIEDRPQYSGNTLSLNRGDDTYAQIGWFSQSQASGWTWCPVLIDVDLDGYEDIIFPTGHERDMMNVDVTDRAEVLKNQQRLSKLEQLRLRSMFDRFDTPNVVFRNRGDLTFEDVSHDWGFTANEVSQGIALGDLDNDGDLDVVVNNLNGLAGSANYEDGLTNGGYLRLYDLNRNVAGDSVLGPTSSTGPLALADVDGDGDLDLFIGGRVVAGRYPEPADSMLLRNEGGRLVVAQRWEKLGLVSGAVFSDLDLDGDPDLVLACDWGPVRVFHNDGGSFSEITGELGLTNIKGWWNGIATGDLDGDGRPDLVVGNWGLNSQFHASPEHPRKVYHGDIDDDGLLEFIEAIYDPRLKLEVPGRGLKPISFALPWLKDQVGSYEAYGLASVQDLYGELLNKTAVAEVNTLASTFFFNRGDRFESRPLPVEAQWTTAMGVCLGDYDGDLQTLDAIHDSLRSGVHDKVCDEV